MSIARPDMANEYLAISTPYNRPLRFGDQWYRLAAKATCRKCGGHKIQILRAPRFRSTLTMQVPLERPDPNNDKVSTSFMVRACDNMIGCLECNEKGVHPCACGKMKAIHTAGCPYATLYRSGPFALAAVRSSMISMTRKGSA